MCRLTLLFIGFVIFNSIISCKKDCCFKDEEDCSNEFLSICDSSSLDLERFYVRIDSSFQFGSTTANKVVTSKGAIPWVANNTAFVVDSTEVYWSAANYSDTSWVGLEHWAFRRETIVIKFNPFVLGRQSVWSKSEFELDSNKAYGVYRRYIDDYVEAKWDIDDERKSYISIYNFDLTNNIVEGEFELFFTLKEQSTLPGRNYSDKIYFRCGQFRSYLRG